MSSQHILTTAIIRIVVHKSSDHAKLHFDLFFYHNISVKENAFLFQLELKKAFGDTLTRAALSGLIGNGKAPI